MRDKGQGSKDKDKTKLEFDTEDQVLLNIRNTSILQYGIQDNDGYFFTKKKAWVKKKAFFIALTLIWFILSFIIIIAKYISKIKKGCFKKT